ncbi:hypothetical protein ACSSS7_007815 [Eimeria intestinalis]
MAGGGELNDCDGVSSAMFRCLLGSDLDLFESSAYASLDRSGDSAADAGLLRACKDSLERPEGPEVVDRRCLLECGDQRLEEGIEEAEEGSRKKGDTETHRACYRDKDNRERGDCIVCCNAEEEE